MCEVTDNATDTYHVTDLLACNGKLRDCILHWFLHNHSYCTGMMGWQCAIRIIKNIKKWETNTNSLKNERKLLYAGGCEPVTQPTGLTVVKDDTSATYATHAIHSSIYTSMHSSILAFIYSSIHPCINDHKSIYQSIHSPMLSIYPSLHSSILSLSSLQSTNLFTFPLIHPSFHPNHFFITSSIPLSPYSPTREPTLWSWF